MGLTQEQQARLFDSLRPGGRYRIQVSAALGQLERLLAAGDIRGEDLWQEIAPSIGTALEPAATRLAQGIARFD